MSNHAATYPTDQQYRRWQDAAEEHGMSLSEWIDSMVEAGQKKFEVEVVQDETNVELREQRNDLRRRLSRSQKRVSELEEELYSDERSEIIEYVEENPGVEEADIQQHIIETASERTSHQLHSLQGRKITEQDGRYYPLESE